VSATGECVAHTERCAAPCVLVDVAPVVLPELGPQLGDHALEQARSEAGEAS
jgi:hypothetical protein